MWVNGTLTQATSSSFSSAICRFSSCISHKTHQLRPKAQHRFHLIQLFVLPEFTQDSSAAMVKTGYAMILSRISQAARPAPSRKENRTRLLRLHEFIARGVLPNKFPINSKKTWRGSLDPTGQDAGLSADNPTIRSLQNFVDRLQDKVQPQLFLQLRIMVLEAQIYLEMRKAYEVVVNEKFIPQIKDKYRKWVSDFDLFLHQEL